MTPGFGAAWALRLTIPLKVAPPAGAVIEILTEPLLASVVVVVELVVVEVRTVVVVVVEVVVLEGRTVVVVVVDVVVLEGRTVVVVVVDVVVELDPDPVVGTGDGATLFKAVSVIFAFSRQPEKAAAAANAKIIEKTGVPETFRF